MQFCFIVDNSLTMIQKTSNNETNFFDQIKFSLQTVIKGLFRNMNSNNPQQMKDIIHLFVTSSAQPISTFGQSIEMHLMHQIKNLQCTIPTFPSQVIESALYHVGKFRCLNQSQTFLGYRQGTIFSPCLIFFITNNLNRRHTTKIYKKFIESKFQLRSQYKFITIKYCSSSPQQTSIGNIQKFKATIQKQSQSLMMQQLMKKINGSLQHVYSSDQLTNFIQSAIYKFNPTLSLLLQNKQYKIYNKEITSIKFSSFQIQSNYLEKVKTLNQLSQINSKYFESDNREFYIEALPLPRRTQIPLPFDMISKIINQRQVYVDQFLPVKFYVDFTKEYIGELDSVMKYMVNAYQVMDNKIVLDIVNQFNIEKKFPIFYEKRSNQFLIGYLRLYYNAASLGNKSNKPFLELNISFSNFLNLNSIIRSYKQHNPSVQQYFQNYVSTLPIFYHKFLSHYLKSLNILLSEQTNLYQNINTKPIGIINLRCFQQRLAEKKELILYQKKFFQEHQQNQSQCCSIYSKNFQRWEAERSEVYNQKSSSASPFQNELLNTYFKETLKNLNDIKVELQIFDYLRTQQIHSTSFRKQQQKYIIRRDDDELNQLVGDLLGNPFKKINKRVKVNDDAESLWVQPEQLKQMKEMLQIQKQIAKQISSFLPNGQNNIEIKSDNIYDQLVEIKQKIAQNVKKLEQIEQEKEHQNATINKNLKQLQDSRRKQQYNQKSALQNKFQNSIEQISMKQYETYTKSNPKSMKEFEETQNQKTYSLESEPLPECLQILEEINTKFTLKKSMDFQFPMHLINNQLYLNNKKIFYQVLNSKK